MKNFSFYQFSGKHDSSLSDSVVLGKVPSTESNINKQGTDAGDKPGKSTSSGTSGTHKHVKSANLGALSKAKSSSTSQLSVTGINLNNIHAYAR